MYYFFKTSEELRDGQMKNTLRALPKQFLEDGTPVDTTYNVQSPKKPSEYPFGTREEYPLGTYFCSDHLEEVLTKQTPLYSVYRAVPANGTAACNFHPVSIDPNFNYLKPDHKNDAMNIAFASYLATSGNMSPATAAPARKPRRKADAKTSAGTPAGPADINGKAVLSGTCQPFEERWTGQIDTETNIYINWMRRLLNRSRNMPPQVSSRTVIADMLRNLYSCGENIDTITNGSRLNDIMSKAGVDFQGITALVNGPYLWYLDKINGEHWNGSKCSAVTRGEEGPDVEDAFEILNNEYANQFGTSPQLGAFAQHGLDLFKTAVKTGWTLDEMLDPDKMKSKFSLDEYLTALTDGTFPVPKKKSANGSFIEKILADPKNVKPKDSEGFHVEDKTWALLLRNLKRKENTILTGPSGTGKTMIVKKLCEKTGTPLTIIQMGSITDPTEQLVGKLDLDPSTGGTRFDWADFALAIQRPGVILLDEVNRIPKNGENILFSCLDDTREINASGAKSTDNRTIKVNPDCVFFATANIGAEFTGTKELDKALETRFMPVEMNYLNVDEEKKILMNVASICDEDADNIAFIASRIRASAEKEEIQTAVSTRETIRCARLVADGFSAEDAMEACFLPMFNKGSGENDPDSERTAVKTIIQQRMAQRKQSPAQ